MQRFQAVADRGDSSVSQLALAWSLAQGEDIVPFPGTRKVKYLEESWAALNICLSPEQLVEIRGFLESVEVAGDTLPPAFKGYNFRDTVEEAWSSNISKKVTWRVPKSQTH